MACCCVHSASGQQRGPWSCRRRPVERRRSRLFVKLRRCILLAIDRRMARGVKYLFYHMFCRVCPPLTGIRSTHTPHSPTLLLFDGKRYRIPTCPQPPLRLLMQRHSSWFPLPPWWLLCVTCWCLHYYQLALLVVSPPSSHACRAHTPGLHASPPSLYLNRLTPARLLLHAASATTTIHRTLRSSHCRPNRWDHHYRPFRTHWGQISPIFAVRPFPCASQSTALTKIDKRRSKDKTKTLRFLATPIVRRHFSLTRHYRMLKLVCRNGADDVKFDLPRARNFTVGGFVIRQRSASRSVAWISVVPVHSQVRRHMTTCTGKSSTMNRSTSYRYLHVFNASSKQSRKIEKMGRWKWKHIMWHDLW